MQDSADQESTVAVGRVFLATEDRHSIGLDPALEPGDALEEARRLRDAPVQDVPRGVVEFGLVGTTAELGTQVQVVDARGVQGGAQLGPVEVGGEARGRMGTDVGDDFDAVLLEQGEEVTEGVVGMPDGEERTMGLVHRSGYRPSLASVGPV
jgi:hypothetical protein